MTLHQYFVTRHEPLAMFLNESKEQWTVCRRHVQKFMRCCILVHPDPSHHLQQHINCLMAHLLCVTTVVILLSSREDEHMIALCEL
jgi:hypothetical protein